MKMILTLLLVVVFLVGCSPGTVPESDSGQNYKAGSVLGEESIDDNVYVIVGKVASSVLDHTEIGASAASFDNYGYFNMWQDGKGTIRFEVASIDPPTTIADTGDFVILKTTDLKARSLLPGDQVTFKCRAQYEAVAALRVGEVFDTEKAETWELDYCRMYSPVILEAK